LATNLLTRLEGKPVLQAAVRHTRVLVKVDARSTLTRKWLMTEAPTTLTTKIIAI